MPSIQTAFSARIATLGDGLLSCLRISPATVASTAKMVRTRSTSLTGVTRNQYL